MRLIDADALERWLEMCYANENPLDYIKKATFAEFLAKVKASPTIDAVPVVRCGQCAKAKKFHNPQMGDLILCNEYRVFTDECGFCHNGAKMDAKEGAEE